jgi:pimeloyl-ACP methyl ester carboxylesterase
MMMRRMCWLILFPLTLLGFSGCFMLNKYIYTDKELEEYYRDKAVKPVYRQAAYSEHSIHYAVVSRSDTLPLLMMIHGAPGAWYGYMKLMDDSLLQQHFKIVSVDRLGYGKSGYGKEVLSTRDQAQAIKSIIDRENTSGARVFIMGRSYGAPIAAWLAIHYPGTFEKLLMISPVIDPEREKFYWFSNLGKTRLMQWMLPDLLNVATREKFSHQEQMALMLPQWEHLNTPTYVLTGEEDRLADTANYSFAKRHITACPAVFVKLKQTGHQICSQQPGLIRQMLMDPSNCKELCEADQEVFREVCFRPEGLQLAPLRAETRSNGPAGPEDHPGMNAR